MPEIKREVKEMQVDYQCPKCGMGYLRPTGTALATYPPAFPHKCNNPNCDYMETFIDKQYPYIEFEPIDNNPNICNGIHRPIIVTAYPNTSTGSWGWDINRTIIPSNNGNNF